MLLRDEAINTTYSGKSSKCSSFFICPEKYTFLDSPILAENSTEYSILSYILFDFLRKNPSIKRYTFLDGSQPRKQGLKGGVEG